LSKPDTLSYTIRRAAATPRLDGDWDSPLWKRAQTITIDRFRPESSDHRPVTRARVLYDAEQLYVMFRVEDQYVRCLTTAYQGPVYEDACVEFFVQPRRDKGYFNFEMNCGGALLLRNVTDPTRIGDELTEFTNVPWRLASQIHVFHSMPQVVEPEIEDHVTWVVEYSVPFTLFEEVIGPLGDVAGQEWSGNFFKCAETNSHPHFASWAPIVDPALRVPPNRSPAIW